MKANRWISGPGARGALAALIVSLVGAGFSAHAGLTRSAATPASLPAPRATGYEAEDHFPGAALIQAIDDRAAPAPGTTGTADLPGLPAGAAMTTNEAGVTPAAPFAMAGGGIDRMRALQCLTTAIYYEAASEPDTGQAAVAQVILNRVRHPAFPATVCGVIYQGSQRRGCQFSYACDGSLARVPMRSAWDRAQRAAARALAGYVYAPVGLATHYHTYAVTPSWNRSLVMTDVEGAHFFHRWKGWWGTAAAFRQPYRGGEPVPGPHLPEAVPTIAPVQIAQATAALAPRTETPLVPEPLAQVTDAYAQSGGILAQDKTTAAENQILDRWKDTGKPIR